MSDKQGSPEKRCAVKRTSEKSESSTPVQSPKKQYKHKRRRRNRVSSSSSDGIVHEVKRDLRHMEKLLLNSGKLHVFRAYFNDPTLDFYTRPEGRKRHPAGRNRLPPDENRAMVALGMQQGADEQGAAVGPIDNNPLLKPLSIQIDEGPPSVVSSRGFSPGSSFATFPPSPPDYNADLEVVPFEGLPPIIEKSKHAAASKTCHSKSKPTSSSSTDHDNYMASASASDSEESVRPSVDANRVAERLNQMVVSNIPAPLPVPEPMSLSSDSATPRESDQE